MKEKVIYLLIFYLFIQLKVDLIYKLNNLLYYPIKK